jgi:hypothetical protein
MHQQVGNFLELAAGGEVEDVIAAVVQVIAGAADRAQRGVARRDVPDRATDFLGLNGVADSLMGFSNSIDATCVQSRLLPANSSSSLRS